MDNTYTQERKMANAIRFLSAEMIEKAKSGHPGMPLGMADVATVLFTKFIKTSTNAPKWFDRDRFVLSGGHASSMLYAIYYLMGYKDITLDDLKEFRQLEAKTAGHPEYGNLDAIDMTTGPLGEGISSAVGMALAEQILSAKYGSEYCNHYTYVIMGDGCLMEGVAHETLALAGHWKLNKLIAFWDNNDVTIDGHASLATSTDQIALFKAYGWNTISIDGHDYHAIEQAISQAQKSDKPTLIACKTTIGFGSPHKAGTPACHGSPLGQEELALMRQNLGWNYAPFEVPSDILSKWQQSGTKCDEELKNWQERIKKAPAELLRILDSKLPQNWQKDLIKLKETSIAEQTKVATREASHMCLEAIMPNIPELIGGSADLSGPNKVKTQVSKTILAGDYNGNHLEFGVREHAMGAIMNGLALHGGLIPFGGTFFVFSDFMRPAIRLSALMGLKEIYVLTHDSIGVGEDGPTHQPIEHLASFRAMPNILTFRPCDIIETAESWELALSQTKTPAILALSRQSLPLLRKTFKDNLTSLGAYVISDCQGQRDATIIATGSEVSLAVEAQQQLKQEGLNVAVVSMPCAELFDAQPITYQEQILGTAPRIAVEAASKFGWEKYVGINGDIIGMDGFGASAPASDLYKYFGITTEEVVDAVKNCIK